jgi:hypothetical protein
MAGTIHATPPTTVSAMPAQRHHACAHHAERVRRQQPENRDRQAIQDQGQQDGENAPLEAPPTRPG